MNNQSIDKIGLWVLLFLMIILKMTGYISWPWWLVLTPMWVPIALVVITAIVIFIVTVWNGR